MKIQHTPWGPVQDQEWIAEGIVRVHTAGHGGFVLSDERLAQMPDQYKLNTYGTGRYFEEDCEWSLVVLAFPHEFTSDMQKAAYETARMVYKELNLT